MFRFSLFLYVHVFYNSFYSCGNKTSQFAGGSNKFLTTGFYIIKTEINI